MIEWHTIACEEKIILYPLKAFINIPSINQCICIHRIWYVFVYLHRSPPKLLVKVKKENRFVYWLNVINFRRRNGGHGMRSFWPRQCWIKDLLIKKPTIQKSYEETDEKIIIMILINIIQFFMDRINFEKGNWTFGLNRRNRRDFKTQSELWIRIEI